MNGETVRVRVKTADRRQAILEVAHDVFQEMGFERASMAVISRRLGGSKGTLYGYFRSKEELFETAMKTVSGDGDAARLETPGAELGEAPNAPSTSALDGPPRTRATTEDRRQAIVKVALETFREVGFERASMTTIARRLGRSKGSLYGFFRSKEALFEAAMKAGMQAPGDQIMELLDGTADDLRAVLTRFAKAYVRFILSEEDKSKDISLEYWCKCCDLDCDGRLTPTEMLVRRACACLAALLCMVVVWERLVLGTLQRSYAHLCE